MNRITPVLRTRLPNGVVIVTFRMRIPEPLAKEFLTHRLMSRNGASSRAVPVDELCRRVVDEGFVPEHWTMNERGMQGHTLASPEVEAAGRALVLAHRDFSVQTTRALAELGLHKQIANRYIAAHLMMEYLVTARESHLAHFLDLRTEAMTEPHFRDIAHDLAEMLATTPIVDSAWHMPFITPEEFHHYREDCAIVSATRCRRVSYFRLDKTPPAWADDRDAGIEMGRARPMHASPFEHQVWHEPAARNCAGNLTAYGPLGDVIDDGVVQFRKTLAGEFFRGESWS